MPAAITRVARTVSERSAHVLSSRTAKRIYVGLLALLIIFLWVNMVRRALGGSGSHYQLFTGFSRDLIFDQINVYLEYPEDHTITKYPPFFGLIYAPLVPLPIAIGAAFKFLFDLALALGATYLSVLTVVEGPQGRRNLFWLFVITFVLTSGIIGSNLETGQVNIFIVFFLCLSLFTFRVGRDVLAGLLLGFITAIKITPGLFVLYFAYKREYRMVAGALLGLVICWVLIPPLVFGLDGFFVLTRGWLHDLMPFIAEGTLAEGIGGFRHTNQSLSAAFHRFFTETPAGVHRTDFYINVTALGYVAAGRIVKVISLAIIVGLVWLSRTPMADRRSLGLAFEYSLVMIATLFISPISWIDHYVILLFPNAAAVYFISTRPSSRARKIVLYSVIASFILVSSSASHLMQAFSLPFFGALVLALGLAVALRAETHLPEEARAPASAAVALPQ